MTTNQFRYRVELWTTMAFGGAVAQPRWVPFYYFRTPSEVQAFFREEPAYRKHCRVVRNG